MDRNCRYEPIPDEEANVPAEPVDLVMVLPPPAYQEAVEDEGQQTRPTVSTELPGKLPSYETATTLPTYEEAEQSKKEEAEMKEQEESNSPEQERMGEQVSKMEIGTDSIFLCTFILSFVFNWVGFAASLCLTYSVAGRCGALSGLGLSIVKWVAIVKHNDWGTNIANDNSFLWWLLILGGFMIFVRGAVQYVRIKYEWQRISRLYKLISPI